MKENKIPTADEFFMEYLDVDCDFMESMREQLDKCSGFNFGTITDTMIEFAKLHVAEALKEVKKNIKVYIVEYGNVKGYKETVEESILNAYPLNNIK